MKKGKRIRILPTNKNLWIVLIVDIVLLTGAYLFAHILRFEGEIPDNHFVKMKQFLPFVIFTKIVGLHIFRAYAGMWRYTSIIDAFNIAKAMSMSTALILITILFFERFEGHSRSVYVIDFFLSLFLLSSARLTVRIILAEKSGTPVLSGKPFSWRDGTGQRKKRLLIIGAGDAGEKILRELMDNPKVPYSALGFVDDDLGKRGLSIHGVPVLGSTSELKSICDKTAPDEILIAIPSATPAQMREIIRRCEDTGIKARTTPGIAELIEGRVLLRTLREVSFEDLIGRQPVELDLKSIGAYLSGRSVLVTGAAGSIGSELCRQIASFRPRMLVLLDKTENSLFQLEREFKEHFPRIQIRPLLGDVRNNECLERIFEEHDFYAVFHAAAYKHVPIVELNPWEGVLNNVLGTRNLVEACSSRKVKHLVMISTDKAVKPVSVMGATKRVAEIITNCHAVNGAEKEGTKKFVSVRFGNVIGSEGSVVHVFKRQIERFGPVTVTHPDMKRYFMTIPEAAKLILQAAAYGRGGETFILDMGAPLKVVDVAKELIRLSGFEPGRDIEIKFTGVRPGEKLEEELRTDGEGILPSPHRKIFVLKGENDCSLDWLNGKIDELVELAMAQDAGGIKAKLKEIVPDYNPYSEEEIERLKTAAGS